MNSFSHLFEPLQLREVHLRNRIGVSPMCQYSSEDGFANEWHLVHLGSRAVGGAALVFTEAAAVEARGRISPQDLGIYSDAHVEGLARITHFIREHGAAPGIQLAHAGRKSSTARPWETGGPVPPEEGGWRPVVAPSPLAFDEGYPAPEALDEEGITDIVQAFGAAAARALAARFEVIEIPPAHGYLIHEFLSPLSNRRTDQYGGSFENRTRLLREITMAIRRQWPERYPLAVRLSTTDWHEEGWGIQDSVEVARQLKPLGVDLVDCSSGGIIPGVRILAGAGYQTAFAQQIRQQADIHTAAVGMITSPQQADHVLRTGQADLVLLGRVLLREPYWPLRAAQELGVPVNSPPQYARAWAR